MVTTCSKVFFAQSRWVINYPCQCKPIQAVNWSFSEVVTLFTFLNKLT